MTESERIDHLLTALENYYRMLTSEDWQWADLTAAFQELLDQCREYYSEAIK